MLLVAYHFPPFGGSGVQRVLKFAKYLPRHGWRAHVLTAGHLHYPLMDPALLKDAGDETVIHRVKGWEPGGVAARLGRLMPTAWRSNHHGDVGPAEKPRVEDRLYWRLERWTKRASLPEVEMRWLGAAARAARRIIRRHGIQAVMTTSPPQCIQNLGLRIKRGHGLPWIADLRDPIVDNFATDSEAAAVSQWRQSLEQQTCESADRVLVTCSDLRERLVERHGLPLRHRIEVIPNGFDPDDRPTECARNPEPRKFVLGYIGSFYQAQTIEPLLKALRAFAGSRPDVDKMFELRIAGSISARQRPLMGDDDRRFIRELNYLPHGAALREMSAADALFLMTPPGDAGRFCIPAKIFEYLAFGRHVIAVIHPGTALKGILRAAGSTSVVHQGDISGLTHAIAAQFDAWSAGRSAPVRDPGVLAQFTRDEQASQLADVLDALAVRRRVRRRLANSVHTGDISLMPAVGKAT